MIVRKFVFEKLTLLVILIHSLLSVTPEYFLPIIFILFGTSLKIEKAKPYTPLILILVAVSSLASVIDFFLLQLFYIILSMLCIYLSSKVQVFEIPNQFVLYDKYKK